MYLGHPPREGDILEIDVNLFDNLVVLIKKVHPYDPNNKNHRRDDAFYSLLVLENRNENQYNTWREGAQVGIAGRNIRDWREISPQRERQMREKATAWNL